MKKGCVLAKTNRMYRRCAKAVGASLALLAVATNKKPPKAVRILCGIAGSVILLAGLVIVFRALLG